MSSTNYRDCLIGKFQADIREAERQLGAGKAKDFVSYRETVGQIGAMRRALTILEDEWRRMFSEESEEL